MLGLNPALADLRQEERSTLHVPRLMQAAYFVPGSFDRIRDRQ